MKDISKLERELYIVSTITTITAIIIGGICPTRITTTLKRGYIVTLFC